MAAINSANKTLSGNSQNCDVTLNGQPDDKNLSVKVSATHTVSVNPNSTLVSLVSNSQSSVLKDSNNTPYRKNSIQYAWKENRNTEGSISGTISIKQSRNAAYTGEFFIDGIYKGALPLTITGISCVPTSDTRSEREVNATITCKVPINTSTNDLHGGTYTFTSDMHGKQGFDGNVRGMFQTYYNEEEPFGTLQIWDNNRKNTCTLKYDANGWKDNNTLTKVDPSISVSSNLPSIKYGDAGGTLSISSNYTESPTPSSSTYNYFSTSNFWTTPSEKANSHVNARDIIYNYSFSRSNSKNTNTDSGKFTVHQEGGGIAPLDPEISYTWNVDVPESEKNNPYFTWSVVGKTVNATKNDGKIQTFSYNTGVTLRPTSKMDGSKPKLDGTITLTSSLNSGSNNLGTSKISFSNGVQVSDRNYKVTCTISTNYVTNDTISPRSINTTWTCPGAKWTVNPEFTLNLKVSYKDGNGTLHDEGPQIPGTGQNASVKISKDGNNYSNEINYVLNSGTWSSENQDIDLSRYKTYVSMSDNTPTADDGNQKNTGKLTSTVTIDNCKLNSIPSSGGNGKINIVPSELIFTPSTTLSFPALNWVVKASITSKTNYCTGTLTIDDSSKERTITQSAIDSSDKLTYSDANATVSLPDWCTMKTNSDTPKWTHEDTSSEKNIYFSVDENPIKDFTWKITSSESTSKITYNPVQSARSADITVTMPTGITTDSGKSKFTQNITQNLGGMNGKIKVESVKGYTGIYAGQLIDWNTNFTWGNPSANQAIVNYTVSISVTSGVDAANKISPSGTTISGTITTGGSSSNGTPIDLYAKFVLTGTNNDDAKYEGTENKGFKEFSGTISGASTSLTKNDYDIRCYDSAKNNYTVNIDKNNGTFSISIGNNPSSSASIAKVEWADNNGNHNNDLNSRPFKVTAKAGSAGSARTIYIDTKAPGKDWVNAKTYTQDVAQVNSRQAKQTFSVDLEENCQVTINPVTVTIPDSKNEESTTGPSVDIKTGNSSDGCLRVSTYPKDAVSFDARVCVDDNTYSISFFDTNKDHSMHCSVYYEGNFFSNTYECGFTFKYRACGHPDGYQLYSYYGNPNGIECNLGRLTGCKAEYSTDNKNWTNFTGANGQNPTVTFKSSEISTRYSEDHEYTKKIYARIVDSSGNEMYSTSGTAKLTVYGVKYYNS